MDYLISGSFCVLPRGQERPVSCKKSSRSNWRLSYACATPRRNRKETLFLLSLSNDSTQALSLQNHCIAAQGWDSRNGFPRGVAWEGRDLKVQITNHKPVCTISGKWERTSGRWWKLRQEASKPALNREGSREANGWRRGQGLEGWCHSVGKEGVHGNRRGRDEMQGNVFMIRK